MEYLLMTFESTHEAIKTEKALGDLPIEMIPTPRQLSTSCGLSLKTGLDNLHIIKTILGDHYNKKSQAYHVDHVDKVLTFKKV